VIRALFLTYSETLQEALANAEEALNGDAQKIGYDRLLPISTVLSVLTSVCD